MGVLAAADRGQAEAKPEPEAREEPVVREPEHDDEGGADPFVAPQESRRERAKRLQQEAIQSALAEERKTWETRLTEQENRWQQRFGELHGRFEHARGQLETIQRQPQQPQQQGPDPDALEAEAQKRLDSNDFNGYQQLTRQASQLRTQRAIEEATAPLKKQLEERGGGGQQMDPFMLSMLAGHRNVAMQGRRGMALMDIRAREISFNNPTWTHEQIVAEAFKRADAELGEGAKVAAQQAAATTTRFDQSSAAALAGVSSGKTSGGGGGGDKKPLTPYQKQVAATMKMSEEEYRAWADNPEEAAQTIRRKRA